MSKLKYIKNCNFVSFDLYISNIENGPISSFTYLFILTFSLLFLFLIDQKKKFIHVLIP